MSQTVSLCAACGRPGHRYGRNEGMDRFDPQACINGLIGENERLRQALHDTRMMHAYDDDHPCEACREELIDAGS